MSLSAGRLRHRVLLQDFQKQTDSAGNVIQDSQTGELVWEWVDIANLWAEIVPSSAREFISAQAIQSKVTARITIRHREDVKPTMRILHRGKIYVIEGVLADPDSGLEYLTLPCSSGVEQ